MFASVRNSIYIMRPRKSQVSFSEGVIVEDGEKGPALEMDVDNCNNEENANEADTAIEEGATDENGRGDGEKDAIDELERIVEA